MRIESLKLKPSRTLLQTFLFLFAAFLISSLSLLLGYVLKVLNPSEYGLAHEGVNDLEITYKEILFFTSLVLSFLLLSFCFRYIKRPALRMPLISLALLYLFAAALIVLVDVVHYLIFAYRMTFSSFQTILNTNPGEAKEFITLYYSFGSILAIVLFVRAAVLLIFRRKELIRLFSSPAFFISTLVIGAFGVLDFIQVSHSMGNGTHNVRYWDIIIGEYNEYRAFNRKLEAEKNNQNLSKEYNGFFERDTLSKTLVFVVSESLNKRHMSCYGYSRPTTPGLDKDTALFKFSNAVTSAALTIDAVPALFCNGHFTRRINLVSLLNKMGYETSWISNQSAWGKSDGPIVLLSRLCKNTVFLDGQADDSHSNTSPHYDEDILPRFEQALGSGGTASKFIVLHLMGCHFDYEKRYPAKWNYFTGQPPARVAVNTPHTYEMLNYYDNAMRYHDSVINGILSVFSKYGKTNNAALVFLSDHGEELYENRNYAGHGYPACKATSEIPFFTLLSPAFKTNYPALAAAMKKRAGTPYSSSDNFYTLLHLLNINSESYEQRILKNGFFSSSYDSTRPRMVMGEDYSKMTR